MLPGLLLNNSRSYLLLLQGNDFSESIPSSVCSDLAISITIDCDEIVCDPVVEIPPTNSANHLPQKKLEVRLANFERVASQSAYIPLAAVQEQQERPSCSHS